MLGVLKVVNLETRYIVMLKGYYYDEDESRYMPVLINSFEFTKGSDADSLYNAIDLRNVRIAYADCEFEYIECKLMQVMCGMCIFELNKYSKEF